jgi:hypothetical protein
MNVISSREAELPFLLGNYPTAESAVHLLFNVIDRPPFRSAPSSDAGSGPPEPRFAAKASRD